MTQDEFKAMLGSNINTKFEEILNKRHFLTYVDGMKLTAVVRNVFKNKLKIVPPEVEAACQSSEAVLAPSAKEWIKHIKAVIGISGGAAGIAMIIGGVGAALGWGAGVIASITAFFVGTSISGPIGWIVGGFTVIAVAAYFALTGNPEKDTERFINVLKEEINKAIDDIWDQYSESLSQE